MFCVKIATYVGKVGELISFAVGSRRKRSFQWNMGLMNADSKFEQNVCNRDFNINVQKMLLKN